MDEEKKSKERRPRATRATKAKRKGRPKRGRTPLNAHQDLVMRQVVLAAAPLTVQEVSRKLGITEVSARRLICRMRRRAAAKGHEVAGPGSKVMPMSRTVLPESEDRHRLAVRLDRALYELAVKAADRAGVSVTVIINDALEVCRGRLARLAEG